MLPIIDISDFEHEPVARANVAAQIEQACRESGFFYIVGHGIDEHLQQRLEDLSRRFFAQTLEAKLELRMERGGRAWRGYFPVGGELTSGRPDLKEGLYLGAEISADHPLVKAGTPMHGPNLFPMIAGFRETVLDYMAAMTALGQTLMRAIALSLDLPESFFFDNYTANPFVLFRIFNYPPDTSTPTKDQRWGVGEHTDYGLLTILKQDEAGGLEVKSNSGWVEAKPIAHSFVCNIGDMLDRMTGGLYRSTPHRVKNPGMNDRLSFPFFFDPNFFTTVRPLDLRAKADGLDRWDGLNIHAFDGTYGEYLINKVSKVFPQLRDTL